METNTPLTLAITGATGFLGGRFAEMAAARGHRIRCLVRPTSQTARLKAIGATLIRGDLTNPKSLAALVAGADVCIHLAAHVGHGSWEDYYRFNVTGSRMVCEAIRDAAPPCRLVHCSTISALKVGTVPDHHNTHYGLSKHRAETEVRACAEAMGIPLTVIYPGLIYGPGDHHFVPVLIDRLRRNRLSLISGGEAQAPVIYVDDLCRLFLTATEDRAAIGGRYLGVGRLDIGIHDFIRMLARRSGSRVPTRVWPKPPLFRLALLLEALYRRLGVSHPPALTKRLIGFFSASFRYGTSGFDANLDWSPGTPYGEGLDQAFNWMKENAVTA